MNNGANQNTNLNFDANVLQILLLTLDQYAK